jgi:hypothetical protein
VINQLAEEYSEQPVVFLDYHYDMALEDGLPTYVTPPSRWDVIRASAADLGLTWAVVDSGRLFHQGAEEPDVAYEAYTTMIDDSLLQPAQAEITATWWREGHAINVLASVTNNSTITLSPANNAGVHAIVKEAGALYPTHTTLHPALNAAMAQISSLAPGETGTYHISIPDIYPTNWDNLEFIVLVDYQTAPEAAYNQLQAVFAQPATTPASIAALPNNFHFMISEADPTIPEFSSTILGDTGITWTASVDKPWLTIDRSSGTTGDSIVPTVNTASLAEGFQTATIMVLDDDGIWHTGISVTVFKLRPVETLSRIYLPVVGRK